MRSYWTLGRVDEHPSKTRKIDYVNTKLSDHACQAFRSKLELAKSDFLNAVVTTEEDMAPNYEVVQFVGDGTTEQIEGHGVDGVFVDCVQIEDRTSILDWLRELATLSNPDEAKAAEKNLKDYDDVRDLFD